jgi:hypothetical protein
MTAGVVQGADLAEQRGGSDTALLLAAGATFEC